ncbi:hypothetical protein [Billgrantia desiderata]|uniref:hypothetical protein n=1 Tax=Billgrantia desiderata TaxID=52021 RepID=UPI001F471711|nr:hypothetical protein [Halomonas desiderata]
MDIFVSRPTWVSTEFEAGLEVFLTSLTNMGLVPRTLGSSDYPSKAPLDEVIEIMDECKGAVILGYPQVLVSQGAVKGSELETEMLLPTEWNHIEAALAYSKGIPLILFHHLGVSRGVFDRGVMNAFIHEVDLCSPTWSMDSALNGAIQKWKSNCLSGNANFGVTAKVDPSKPVCPIAQQKQNLST